MVMAESASDVDRLRVLCIGVTGHRYLRDPHDLIAPVDWVLTRLAAHWSGAPMTVISSLAEGADRLVVDRALTQYHARLVVPLPLAEADYARDFHLPGSRIEFDRLLARADQIVRFPPAPNRPAAYSLAGAYMLEQIQVLIALWDGRPARGDGGTGTVVARARARRLPLAWIRACNCQPDMAMPKFLLQGELLFENF